MQGISQDREYRVFLLGLGAVVLWELLAASLEWSMDERVSEYLGSAEAAGSSRSPGQCSSSAIPCSGQCCPCSPSAVPCILCFLIVPCKLPQQRKMNYSQLLAADCSEMRDSEEEDKKDWLVKAMEDESFNRNWIQQRGIS